ncbi:Integrator complex subunit 2 [Holothuria leucospilota]|uniref:Integrator complex subunit 2 n=1 Tax=Holothuria leucospilota TaxID=206669 RepID=A0A9Q1CFE3_HOLLE|nr:Integrator complex subunit 2 [Holothuria leucospilota]
MVEIESIKPHVFEAMQSVNIAAISNFSDRELRPVLTCLVRMSLCCPIDCSKAWLEDNGGRKEILKVLSGLEIVNSIVALLSVDFSSLEQDAKKELQLRQKLGEKENNLTSNIKHGFAQEFEKSEPARRLRLVVSELLFIASHESSVYAQRPCELFENEVFLDEVSDVLCIAQAELPSLLPMEKMATILLRVKYGPQLLCRLIANVSDSFSQVCRHLIVNGERQDEDNLGGRKRTEMLKMLVAMNPSKALSVRALTVEHCRLPGLAVALTLEYSHRDSSSDQGDVVSFISGLLLSNNTSVRSWFAQFVNIGNKLKSGGGSFVSVLTPLRAYLLEEVKRLTPFEGFHGPLSEEHVVEGSAIMRLFCALKGMAGLKFQPEEIHHLSRLLTSHPPPTAGGIRFINMSLCMLLACPSLVSVDGQIVLDWINWLVAEGPEFERKSGVSASFSEMLLLMAIHFHSNQMQAVLDLICSTLGMKIAVRINSLAKIRLLFTQEVFTEQVVAAHAVTVAVTPSLTASHSGFLPVHCVYHLLKSRAFSKHNVPIKDWIYQQILNCSTPLHSLLPPLLETFVQTSVVPIELGSKYFRNDCLTEQEILSVFGSSSLPLKVSPTSSLDTKEKGRSKRDRLTSQLLMLYYLLLYEDCLLTNTKQLVIINQKPESYSTKLLSQLPVKYLFHEAQRHLSDYASLYPSLLRLLVTHFPHLCLVEDWMEEASLAENKKLDALDRKTVTHSELKKAFGNVQSDSTTLMSLLEQLLQLDDHVLMGYASIIVDSLKFLLEPEVPLKVVALTVQVWKQLNIVMPRRLKTMTVNALAHSKPVATFTEEDLILDPLISLRCDLRVYRCPPLMDIVLNILRAYLAASRAFLAAHLQANPAVGIKSDPGNNKALPSDSEREELKGALIAAQEAAATQILLEVCLPFENEEVSESQLNALREVRCQVCSVLHQMFIADPGLAKLVHFQGYPSDLLPVTVAGIPSMHICLDFIPELLSQPQLSKQIFAIQLTSQLCLQFALPKSLSVARLAINVMSTLLSVLSGLRWREFFSATAPCLANICTAFPPMYDDVTSLLIQIGRIAHSRLGSNGKTPHLVLSEHCSLETRNQAKNSLSQTEMNQDQALIAIVETTFASIVKNASFTRGVS